MTNEATPEMIEKIKKLLAKADSAKEIGNIAEAEAFAIKAQQMMLQYNIDRAKLLAETGQKYQMNEFHIDWAGKTNRHESDWVKELVISVAFGNLCKPIILSNSRPGFVAVLGQKHNVELVEYIVDQLVERARPMAKEVFKDYRGMEKRNTFIRGFLRGFAIGLKDKYMEEISKAKQQYDADNTNPMGLMIINNGEVLAKFVNQKYPHLGYAKSTRLSGSGGYEKGKIAGKNINISKGVGGSAINRKTLN